jgi:hypothetical protein
MIAIKAAVAVEVTGSEEAIGTPEMVPVFLLKVILI